MGSPTHESLDWSFAKKLRNVPTPNLAPVSSFATRWYDRTSLQSIRVLAVRSPIRSEIIDT